MIEFWLREHADRLAVRDEASFSEMRARVHKVGSTVGLERERIEAMAIVASELASNQLHHAGGGRLVCHAIRRDGLPGLEILAADKGRGIPAPHRQLAKSVHTLPRAGAGLGEGLGAVMRLSDAVDLDVRENEGTLIRARAFAGTPKSFGFEYALLGRPHPCERRSGDSGLFVETATGFVAALADGVGHGPDARESADCALSLIRSHREEALDALIARCDLELKDGRGASLCLCRYDGNERRLDVAGAGDVIAQLLPVRRKPKFFSSSLHTAGLNSQGHWRALVETEAVEAGSFLIMATDGLKSAFALEKEPALLRQHPVMVAGYLLEEFSRGSDDATVLAVRFAAPIGTRWKPQP